MTDVRFSPGVSTQSFQVDNLFLTDQQIITKSITLAQDAGETATVKRGQLLVQHPTTLKYVKVAAAETTVALNATGEVIKNNLAATDLLVPFVLAKPSIPGTLTLAVTADGSATVVKALGTDNGSGVGVGADGRFTIDYQTGQGVAYITTAPTAGHDLKAGYTHRAIASGYQGVPSVILTEDIIAADLVAGDVVSIGYEGGHVRGSALTGYSAGYRPLLRDVGILVD